MYSGSADSSPTPSSIISSLLMTTSRDVTEVGAAQGDAEISGGLHDCPGVRCDDLELLSGERPVHLEVVCVSHR